MRDAPSMEIAHALQTAGALVKGYDPVSMNAAARVAQFVQMADDPYDLAEGCDALVVVTDWNEFKHLDLKRIKEVMRRPVIVDGRNIYEPGLMQALGFDFLGIGRGYNGAQNAA
jgi:UDPglucose 6-dehydrogenase